MSESSRFLAACRALAVCTFLAPSAAPAFDDPADLRDFDRRTTAQRVHATESAERRSIALSRIGAGGSLDRLPQRLPADDRLVEVLAALAPPSASSERWKPLLPRARGHEALVVAARRGLREAVQALLAHGADPDHRGLLPPAAGLTPLTAAVLQADPLIVRDLLRAGADVDVPTRSGIAPLSLAIDLARDDIAAMLIDAGADLEREYEGRAALWQAARCGRAAVIEHLIRRGIDPNVRDRSGRTALHVAFEFKQGDAVRLLLDRGADPQHINLDRDTIFELLAPRPARRPRG